VIGLVDDVRDVAVARPPEPEIFTSLLQSEGAASAVIFVRTKKGRRVSTQEIIKTLAAADPDREMEYASNIDELVSRARAPGTARVRLFGALALTALLLSAGGSYGAARFRLSLRMRELGVRMALGGSPLQIVGLVCRHYLKLSVAGGLLGLAISAPVLRLFADRVAPLDTAPYDVAVSSTVLVSCLVVIMASVIVPAIRALQAATPSRLLSADAD
jgi:ABC-type antimicrobial peptide transport system permease subunit